MSLVSFGANFIKIFAEDYNVYLTFKCREDVIRDDRVIEEAKASAIAFVYEENIDSLFDLYSKGWMLIEVEPGE